ncbi:MAG: sugar phosphate isomerase/epimerase [Chthonomonas sp.]|nr:sugar phosphate isomerase/epimerase [Chthonomonas sp.]
MRLGVQLYTLRNLLEEDLLGTLLAVRECGYRFVELAGTHGHTPKKLKTALDKAGLNPVSMHADVKLDGSNVAKLVKDAQFYGCKYVVLPWLGKEHYESGWAAVGQALEPIGQKLADVGLTLCYHNHQFEFGEDADGGIGLDNLYAAADAQFLKAEIDTYWVEYAGFEAGAEIRKVKRRMPLVHFKDLSAGEDKKECAPGSGILSWPSILFTCYEAGAEYAFVEIDNPADALAEIRSGFQFVTNLGVSY